MKLATEFDPQTVNRCVLISMATVVLRAKTFFFIKLSCKNKITINFSWCIKKFIQL